MHLTPAEGGAPRTINSLCDRAFQIAFEQEKLVIDAQDIYDATQKLGLRTDVFHYIVSLNTNERKNQELVFTADKPVAQTKPVNKEQSSPAIARKTEQRSKRVTKEMPDIPGTRIDQTEILHKSLNDITKETKVKYSKRRSLELPAILLLISMGAVALSVLYFCHRTDLKGILECLSALFAV